MTDAAATDAVALVRSLYEAFGRGDARAILDSLDAAVVWRSNADAATIPWGGARDGVDGVAAFLHALNANLEFEVFEPREFHATGDTVTVLGHTRARFRHGGRGRFASDWVHVFTVGGGRLTRFLEFYDTAAMERARGE